MGCLRWTAAVVARVRGCSDRRQRGGRTGVDALPTAPPHPGPNLPPTAPTPPRARREIAFEPPSVLYSLGSSPVTGFEALLMAVFGVDMLLSFSTAYFQGDAVVSL